MVNWDKYKPLNQMTSAEIESFAIDIINNTTEDERLGFELVGTFLAWLGSWQKETGEPYSVDNVLEVIEKIWVSDKEKTDLLLKASEGKQNKKSVLPIENLPNVFITDKRLKNAITPLRNKYAYLTNFDFSEMKFDYNEDGEIIVNSKEVFNSLENAKSTEKEEITKLIKIDLPLLRQLFSATMKAYLCEYGNSITVYIPSFAREMGIDVRKIKKGKSNDLFKKLKEFENLGGIWKNEGFYRAFVFESHDFKENTLTFSSPWFAKILKELITTPSVTKFKKDGTTIKYEIVGVSSLIKPTIVSARSKAVVEIITTLLTGLKQYGIKPEAKRHPKRKYEDKDLVRYKISFKTLIERIPLIMENLKHYNLSNQTALLQRYFCGSNMKKRKEYILIEYIKKYTYVMEYYKDFKITYGPPTINTLSNKIIIEHHGINGDFSLNNPLNKYLFNEEENSSVTTSE